MYVCMYACIIYIFIIFPLLCNFLLMFIPVDSVCIHIIMNLGNCGGCDACMSFIWHYIIIHTCMNDVNCCNSISIYIITVEHHNNLIQFKTKSAAILMSTIVIHTYIYIYIIDDMYCTYIYIYIA